MKQVLGAKASPSLIAAWSELLAIVAKGL